MPEEEVKTDEQVETPEVPETDELETSTDVEEVAEEATPETEDEGAK